MTRDKTDTHKKTISVTILIISMMVCGIFFPFYTPVSAVEQLMEENDVPGGGVGLKININNNVAQCFNASSNFLLTRVSLFVMDEVPANDSLTVEIFDNNDLGTLGDPNDDEPGSSIASTTNI